nr:hypothetical protein [Solibacillus silvestris]
MIDLNDLESSIVEVYNDYYLDVFRFLVCFTGNQNDAEEHLKILIMFRGKICRKR